MTIRHIIVFRADRLLSRGGGLLTAVNISMPSFLIQLPSCADPSFEALSVAVFFDNIWHTIVNVYSPTGNFPEEWFNTVTASFDPPFIFLGDFNINLNPDHPTSSPRVLKFLDWVTSQDLCIMNLDIPTQTGSCGQSSLLDLTILSRTVYNKIKFYVHSDQFDSDPHPIILLSPSSASSPSPCLPTFYISVYSITSICVFCFSVTAKQLWWCSIKM